MTQDPKRAAAREKFRARFGYQVLDHAQAMWDLGYDASAADAAERVRELEDELEEEKWNAMGEDL